jgi:hypothetical protein
VHGAPTSGPGPEDSGNGAPEDPTSPWWQRYGRIIGLVVLAGLTIWGVREFVVGDWETATAFWRGKLYLLPIVIGFAFLDMTLEGAAWMWVYERFGLSVKNKYGVFIFMSSNAGRLMPAQLGRLIRPDAMVRLGRGTLGESLKAEAVVFVLDAISSLSLLAGLLAWRLVHPVAGIVAAVVVITVSLRLGGLIADRLSGTRLELPPGFWWNWRSAATVLIEMGGWIAHGVGFYFLVSGLPGHMGLWDSLFFAPGSAVVGVATGLPGGLGATEGALGASLHLNQVPAEHLALAVGAFRVFTFWIWIPLGWAALLATRNKAKRVKRAQQQG